MSKGETEINGRFSASMNSDNTAMSLITRLLLACGIVGSVLFNVVYLIEGVTRSNYDAWKQPVSDLSMGSYGWMQRADFIVFGLFVACFAVGLRKIEVTGISLPFCPGHHPCKGK